MLNARNKQAYWSKEEILPETDNQMVVTINETKTSVARRSCSSLLLCHHECVSDCFDWINLKKSHVLKRQMSLHVLIWDYTFVLIGVLYFMFIVNMIMMAAMFFMVTRSRNELGSVYGTISRDDYLQSLPKLILSDLQITRTRDDVWVLFVMVMVVLAQRAFGDLRSWLRLVAYISPGFTGCTSWFSNALPISLGYSYDGRGPPLQEATDQSSMCK